MSKLTRAERCRLATLASTHLKSRPVFFYNGSSLWLEWIGFNMATGDPIPRSRKVRIIDNSYFDYHSRQPWGGNQGRALVYLAEWIRYGKMPLTPEDWERWCSPPVSLGDGDGHFLEAIKTYIYGLPALNTTDRDDTVTEETTLCSDCPPVGYPTDITRCCEVV